MADKLEYIKFEERIDWAIDLLKRKFPNIGSNSEVFMKEANDIAKTLFIRSEIAYSGKKN